MDILQLKDTYQLWDKPRLRNALISYLSSKGQKAGFLDPKIVAIDEEL